jgi:hypothetical protein
LSVVLLLFNLSHFYLGTAFRAKDVSRPKSRSTHPAGKLDAILEVLNNYCALAQVYIVDL